MQLSSTDLASIAPQCILAVFGMLVLLVDAIWPRGSRRLLVNLTLLGLILTGVTAWVLLPKANATVNPTMQGMVLADGYTTFFTLVFVLGTGISAMLAVKFLEQARVPHGEYYALLLFTTVGALIMASSINLICIFIGLEILSISLYILAGYQKEKHASEESAVKYFLLGSFASAFFLYGIALIYGATGSVNIQTIGSGFRDLTDTRAFGEPGRNFLLLAGIAMLLVGFCFKVAVVPFHVWTPDVYEGAPTPVTAFMSVAAKAAGFAAFLRVYGSGFQEQNLQIQISAVLTSIAALTMFVGNVLAVVQKGIKRMLAYSSIAHAGYMIAGLVAVIRPSTGVGPVSAPNQAVTAILFYSLVYTVSTLGAFGVLLALRKKGEEVTEISDLAGLGFRYPILGVLMSLFMLSLAGLPPTAGFFGKLALAQALVGMISVNSALVWLVIVFALTSVVSFYYYLGVVRAMYMDKPADDVREMPVASTDGYLKLALGISALGSILFGLMPNGALELAGRVAATFFGPASPFSAMR